MLLSWLSSTTEASKSVTALQIELPFRLCHALSMSTTFQNVLNRTRTFDTTETLECSRTLEKGPSFFYIRICYLATDSFTRTGITVLSFNSGSILRV